MGEWGGVKFCEAGHGLEDYSFEEELRGKGSAW